MHWGRYNHKKATKEKTPYITPADASRIPKRGIVQSRGNYLILFEPYVFGRKIRVQADHRPLKLVERMKKSSLRGPQDGRNS